MKEFEVQGRKRISVYPVDKSFGSIRNRTEVGWASIGSVDIATAKEFVKALQEAIKYAETL